MNNLNYLRIKSDLSFRKLESLTYIDKSALNLMEKERQRLSDKYIGTFCDFYSVSSDFLLGKSDFGIYLNLSTGFITINKQDYENYKINGLINEMIINNRVIRTATKELENTIDPLYNEDLIESINKELKTLSKFQLEKVLKLINEVIK